jgi:hypothetical protein
MRGEEREREAEGESVYVCMWRDREMRGEKNT